MDTAQWPQGIGVVKPAENSRSPSTEKKPRPQKEQALHCPRCSSTNTKFCYYNNYSLTQPRYFCKSCRRYWTEGGSLRNVPVGGGSRKNRRSSSVNNSSGTSKIKATIDSSNITPQNHYTPPDQNPKIHHDPSLAYNNNTPHHHQFINGISEFFVLPSFSAPPNVSNLNAQNVISSSNSDHNTSHIPAMELLKTGNIGTRGLSSFLSLPSDHDSKYSSSVYPSSVGFHMHDRIKPSLSFSLDGLIDQNGYGHIQAAGVEDPVNPSINALFNSKSVSNSNQFEKDRSDQGDHNTDNGFNWNGMLAGGSW